MHLTELEIGQEASGSCDDNSVPSSDTRPWCSKIPQAPRSSKSAGASRKNGAVSLRLHSDHDWEDAKPRIIQLYLHQDMNLDEVMDTMELRYGFKASMNMYKKRLAKWKVRKYQRHRRGFSSSYARSGLDSCEQVRRRQPYRLTPPSTLRQPPDLEKMHQVLDGIKLYATSAMPTSFRSQPLPDHPGCATPSGLLFEDFAITISHAVLSFLSADAATAGSQLRDAFLSLEGLLTLAIELALPKIFYAVLTLAASGFPDVNRILLNHATRLAAVTSGARHPAVLILRRLSELASASEFNSSTPFMAHVILTAWRACHGVMNTDRSVALFLVRRRFWLEAAPARAHPPCLVADPEGEPCRAIDDVLKAYAQMPHGVNFEACAPATITRVLRSSAPDGEEAAVDLEDWTSNVHYELAWFHARSGEREVAMEHMQAAGMAEERAQWQLEQLDTLRILEKKVAVLKSGMEDGDNSAAGLKDVISGSGTGTPTVNPLS